MPWDEPSADGAFHVFVDRLSQGSRGGMAKILEEMGGAALPNVDEMLFLNPGNTIKKTKDLKQPTGLPGCELQPKEKAPAQPQPAGTDQAI